MVARHLFASDKLPERIFSCQSTFVMGLFSATACKEAHIVAYLASSECPQTRSNGLNFSQIICFVQEKKNNDFFLCFPFAQRFNGRKISHTCSQIAGAALLDGYLNLALKSFVKKTFFYTNLPCAQILSCCCCIKRINQWTRAPLSPLLLDFNNLSGRLSSRE